MSLSLEKWSRHQGNTEFIHTTNWLQIKYCTAVHLSLHKQTAVSSVFNIGTAFLIQLCTRKFFTENLGPHEGKVQILSLALIILSDV